jgi:hypothetical protein
MNFGDDPSKAFAISCALSSAISSACVVISGLIFPTMMRKLFMRIIVMIALCDMIGCIAFSIGFPAAHSPYCVFQGVVSVFFVRASFFWTLCFAYQLYSLVKFNKLRLYEYQMHLLCWGISIVLEILPLSTSNYGEDDTLSEEIWCFLRDDDGFGSIWIAVTFTIPIIVSILLMLWLYLQLQCHRSINIPLLPMNDRVKSLVDVLKLYPLTMVLCWIPNPVAVALVNTKAVDQSNNMVLITLGLGSLYGCCISAIFFVNSKEIRERWFQLMFGYRSDRNAVFVDFSEIEVYEEELRESEASMFNELHKRFQRTLSRSFSTSTASTDR